MQKDSNGNIWRDLSGSEARDRNGKVLGVITDQYMEEGKPVFVIDGEYEISTFDVEEFIYPQKYVQLSTAA